MADDYEVEVAELEAIKGGDQEAFSRWLARSEIRLRRSLESFAQSVDVELVVQEVAFRVWERASTITPDGHPAFLMRWAVTVALNAARNDAKRSRRRSEREVSLDVHAEVASPPVARADPFLRARAQRCQEQLTPGLRRVFAAYLADGGQHPIGVLGTSLGMTSGAFRKNLQRARLALEECLGKFGIMLRESPK
jgi:DNA-directed RNA polymerase specialized sigma24 family protein